MKFFNIDMHASVIYDIQTIFEDLGHEVVSLNLSSHGWVNGKKQANIRLLRKEEWKNINGDLCTKFYKKYQKELSNYDGFVHSYPPAFALLFEKFDKPVISVACTRFDFPTYPANFEWLLEGLNRMYNSGQLVPIANNLLDKFYCEEWTGFKWEHISSVCSYMPNKFIGEIDNFLLWTRSELSPNISSFINPDFSIKTKYDRERIRFHKGVVHVPYNLSIMSAFEQYFQNIPLFFPTERFQWELYQERDDVLSEVLFPKTALNFDQKHLKFADWYDSNNFSEVQFYDSFDDLNGILETVDVYEVSDNMNPSNLKRRDSTYSRWNEILRNLR